MLKWVLAGVAHCIDLFYSFSGENMQRCSPHNNQPLSARGFALEIPISIAVTSYLALEKVPSNISGAKMSAGAHDTLCIIIT